MRAMWFALLAACGGDDGGSADDLRVTTTFGVTSIAGAGTSSLDALQGQTLDLEVIWDVITANPGGADDPVGCKSLYAGFFPRLREAHGASAAIAQPEIMDKLDNWEVKLQLCDAGGRSSVGVFATINELNLGLGCYGIPAPAQLKSSDGYPRLSSFVATDCSATILDVVNNRVVSSSGFSITFETGPTAIP